GPGLPRIRDWTREHFDFPGYILPFDPAAFADRDALRARLAFRADEKVVFAAVGGTGVGHHLLRRVVAAAPATRRLRPDARIIVVTGPRIDPASLPRAPGVEYRSFVPDLYAHLAACDLAVVQGGLSTCMELAATKRPFLYFPLRNHFEQNVHVPHRLGRYGPGTKSQVSINAWTAGGKNMSPAPRRFTLMVDEPPELGGVDGAPNPVEVLLSALAGCVTAGIATNAQMFGVPIDAIDIDLEADVDARG